MSTASKKDRVAREMWLLYYNRVLLEKGMITEKEYNRMKLKIQGQTVQ